MTSVETPFVIADAMPPIPLFVAGATSVFLFVTCGDIFPRRRENLSRPGEVFLMEGGSGAAEKLTVLPKAPSLRELAHEVRLKELIHIFPAKRIKSA